MVAAVQQQQAAVLNAQADSNRVLTELAGSIDRVEALYDLAVAFGKARQEQNTERAEALRAELLDAFRQARGKVFTTLRGAESDAFAKVAAAKGEGLRFSGQYQAHAAAPELYPRLLRLAALEEALDTIRKYVVVADDADMQVYIVDLQERLTQSLLDFEMDQQ